MKPEALEKLVQEFFELETFWEEPGTRRPRNKVKARRFFFLFCKEFLNKTIYDLSEKYQRPHYNISSDIKIIKDSIQVNPILERQFNELKDAFNAQKEPFTKTVDFEKGKQKGLELAIHTLSKLL